MALIMVLGVLSVMLIMAISFSIVMRTERVASANRIDDGRLRHLVYTALARATADIASNLNGNVGQLGQVYPSWLVLPSPLVDTNCFTNFGLYTEDFTNPVAYTFTVQQTNVFTNTGLLYELPIGFPVAYEHVFNNEMTNYVPGALWAAAMNENANIFWQPVAYTNNLRFYVGNKATNLCMTSVVGRVSYMILNCSGLWDANYVGGLNGLASLARGPGTNVNEVAISNSPEIDKYVVNFLNNRINDVRYESLYELHQRNLNKLPFGFTRFPENLFVYSYARTGSWDSVANTVTGALYIGGTTTQLAAVRADITNRFAKCGLNTLEQGCAYTNLTRYLDPSPFVTEIVVRNTVTYISAPPAPQNDYQLNTQITIEYWWPYLSEIGLKNSTGTLAVTFGGTVGIGWPGVYTTQIDLTIDSAVNPFVSITLPPFNINCGITLPANYNVEVFYTNKAPRSGAIAATNRMLFNFIANPMVPGVNITNVSREVVDPRFATPVNAVTWPVSFALSIHVNLAAQVYRAAQGLNNLSEWDRIGCAVTNRLLSVGELGFIAYAPWRTFNFANTNHARVFDLFRVDRKANYHGLFNPNSTNVDALAIAFANMPIDQYPLQAGAQQVSYAQAVSIATNLINSSHLTNFVNLSDVAGPKWNTTWADMIAVCTNEPMRESLIRNSMGLFNVRQNVFEILLAAEIAGVDGRFSMRPMRARAVAIVWRDPYTGRMFVRSVKMLRD